MTGHLHLRGGLANEFIICAHLQVEMMYTFESSKLNAPFPVLGTYRKGIKGFLMCLFFPIVAVIAV